MTGSYRLRILGRELQVRSSATPETVQAVESFLNEMVERVESKVRGGDSLGVAILALLTLAEEYLAVKKVQDCGNDSAEQVTDLIRAIDEVLAGAA